MPLPTVVLDVNETLSDLGALTPVLRAVGAPEGLLSHLVRGHAARRVRAHAAG